ncbi:hypothetical protein [Variovorax paradoxus]|uniref:hypothetical protein n=1 Tax=Variovorax paradoxus TaxID=34073 RepID=UPI001ABCCB2B
MELKEVLEALGTDRVIWIDDKFNRTPEQLADQLIGSPELARRAGNADINAALERYEFQEGSNGLDELRQVLVDMSPAERDALSQAFFDAETHAATMATPELSDQVVRETCALLGIAAEDRWTFKDAMQKVEDSCKDDLRVSYIIDLNESGGNDKQGLEVLKTLHQYKSKGTAFLLTHSATTGDEAAKESELLGDMKGAHVAATSDASFPLCVVSKQRLEAAKDRDGIAHALQIAMKRAGLRRSVHEVLQTVRGDVFSAFEAAAKKLLEIPPEQLDEFVVERGHHEGVSELHVVERAITAEVSQRVRHIFATSREVLASTARLRSLRAVRLGIEAPKAHPHLEEFRRMEVWESSELINSSYTPLACGDIFELDDYECGAAQGRKQFLLLGQPCDISVRAQQDRDQEFATFVPLVAKASVKGDDEAGKLRPLQFSLNGKQLFCDYRNAASVRLSILDLAALRDDGRVRFDLEQTENDALLAGMRKVISKRVKAAKTALDDGIVTADNFQLSFRSSSPFSVIARAAVKSKETKNIDETRIKLPKRVTWSLKRTGRVRMPYAAALLRDYLSLQGRDAFDLDFTKDRSMKPITSTPDAPVYS